MAQDTAKALYVVLWDYEAVEDDELTLKKGDMICASVDYLENSFGEWMVGENFRGKQGKFPATYVKPMQPGAAGKLSAPLAMNAKFEADATRVGSSGIGSSSGSRRGSFSAAGGKSAVEGYDDEVDDDGADAPEPQMRSKAEKALRKYLKEASAHHYFDSLRNLGVERIRDLNLVLPSDLRHIGMDETTIERVLSVTSKAVARGQRTSRPGSPTAAGGAPTTAAADTAPAAAAATTGGEDGKSPSPSSSSSSVSATAASKGGGSGADVSNVHRQRSIARAIVDALSPVELVKLKEYIFTPDTFDGMGSSGGGGVGGGRVNRRRAAADKAAAGKILSLEQQNVLLAYIAAQFEALAQFRCMEQLFGQLGVATQVAQVAEEDSLPVGDADAAVAKYPSSQELRQVLRQLIAAQEVLCSFLRKHGLGTSCGGFIHDHVQRTAVLFKSYSKLHPKANHDISHFIANLEHETRGEELLATVVPLKNCLQHLQRSLPFPLRRVKEDSLILAKMSTLLPETHTLALVFRDIAALYNAGEDERRYLLDLRAVLPKVLKLEYHEHPHAAAGHAEAAPAAKKKAEAPIWVKKNCFQNYKVAVAAVLHDEWRKPRLLPDGTYDPRPKDVEGVVYDIANLPFRDLPPKFQLENMLASDNACCFVLMSTWERRVWTREQLEEGAMYQHDAWMQRNNSWAPPEQMLPYADLTEEEKEKDRAIVVVAVEYLRRHFNNKIWASDRAPPRL